MRNETSQQLEDTLTALRKSEERFRIAGQASYDLIYEWHVETDSLEWFGDVDSFLGFEKGEISQDISAWLQLIHPEDVPRLANAVEEHRTSTQPINYQYRIRHKNGDYRYWNDYALPILNTQGKPTRWIGVCKDETVSKLSQLDLESHLQFQKIATEISASFLTAQSSDFDQKLNKALKQLGQHFKLDRSYVFLYSEDLTTMSNTHEWCHSGTDAEKDRIQDLPADYFKLFNKRIQKEVVHIPDVSQVSNDMAAEKKEWLEQGIQSLICVPIFGSSHKFWGFLGFDAVNNLYCWTEEQIRQLQVLADIIGSALERKQSQSKLSLAASVFTNARESIIITDKDGIIVDVNDTFSQMSGYGLEEVIGKKPSLLRSGRHSHEFYVNLWHSLLNDGYWTGEIWNKTKDGGIFVQSCTISTVYDNDQQVTHYVGLFIDITEQKEQQKYLEHIAHHDALTGLPNRVLLSDRIEQMMVQAKRRNNKFAVLYIDLDGFKEVNDQYGHDIGDDLLIGAAENMKSALREEDTIARIGGDEFVALIIDLKRTSECKQSLERLLETIEKPVVIDSKPLQVSASIGVSFYPQEERVEPDQLLRQADQAMYQAKISGRNRYHIFDEAHDRDTRGHYENVQQIRNAIQQDEFVLFYQPKVNMRNKQVVGVEALIRWQHPEKGLLQPASFLPLIENHLVLVELGNWVIESAFSQIEQWKKQGLDLHVSINISAIQLQQTNFTHKLDELLAKHPNVEANKLEFEILETSAMEDSGRVVTLIKECADMAIHFALDDFGTGYSSLTYLKRFPAKSLKIDRSFVRDMLTDSEDLAILQGVIGMAKAFHREVIAEGVESIEQGQKLLELGCEVAQGYAIAKPMPADALITWMQQWPENSDWVKAKVSPE